MGCSCVRKSDSVINATKSIKDIKSVDQNNKEVRESLDSYNLSFVNSMQNRRPFNHDVNRIRNIESNNSNRNNNNNNNNMEVINDNNSVRSESENNIEDVDNNNDSNIANINNNQRNIINETNVIRRNERNLSIPQTNTNNNNINNTNNNNINSNNNNNSNNSPNNINSNQQNRIRTQNRNNNQYNNNVIQDYNEPYLEARHDPFFNFEEIDDLYVGEGVKRIKGFICPISKEDLDKKISDFWDSRRDFSREIWDVLRTCCCSDIDSATVKTLLKMNGITLYKENISAVYDSKGNLYEIPNYCINSPYKYIESSFEQSFEDKPINIRIRYSDKEYKIHITSNTKVSLLKSGLLKELNNPKIEKLRLFYLGKELKDYKKLSKIKSDGIIQMSIIFKEDDGKESIKPQNNSLLSNKKSIKEEDKEIKDNTNKMLEEEIENRNLEDDVSNNESVIKDNKESERKESKFETNAV